MSVFDQLSAPFPANAIHWRAQTLNKDGTSAMALAYIDARDVMDRLDSVLGPENWEDSFSETPKGRLICTLKIRVNGEWISKADGAGDTDVEGEKGAISDALKRAAVKWGVGRYLYDMPITWADCESYEAGGKKRWSKWTPAGLAKLAKAAGGSAPVARAEPVIDDHQWAEIVQLIEATNTNSVALCDNYKIKSLKEMKVSDFDRARAILLKRLPQPEEKAA